MKFGSNSEHIFEDIVELRNKRKVKIYSVENKQREEGIIFLHGFGMPPKFYSTFFEEVGEKISIYAPEFVAMNYFGKNQPHSIFDYGEMAHELVDKISLDKIYLVGHSLGGRIALEVGKKSGNLEGKLSKIVVINPSLPVEYGVTQLLMKSLIEGVKQEHGYIGGEDSYDGEEGVERAKRFAKEIKKPWLSNIVKDLPNTYKLAKDMVNDSWEKLKIRDVPVVMIYSENDAFFKLSSSIENKHRNSIENLEIIRVSGSHDFPIYNSERAANDLLSVIPSSNSSGGEKINFEFELLK